MKLIFNYKLSLKIRFFIAILISLCFIFANKYTCFNKVKSYIDKIISPLYLMINIPNEMLNKIFNIIYSKNKLSIENAALYNQILLNNSELIMLNQYKKENARLHELLGYTLNYKEHKTIAKVIFNINNLYNDQVIIDKGTINGVFEGQPVINSKGVVGQVLTTAKNTSRILLICDATHAIPTQILRNDTRFITYGNGCINDMYLEYLPINTDIKVGDILVTSGIDGRFPEGYPVAIVSSVKLDNQNARIIAYASTIANIKNLHYVILLKKVY